MFFLLGIKTKEVFEGGDFQYNQFEIDLMVCIADILVSLWSSEY
ncbi:hypothetical protein SOVF_137570 [Spinacia oleracea]|nr:hypothetical protein SOVF_137570 [Spinacia oleracea]